MCSNEYLIQCYTCGKCSDEFGMYSIDGRSYFVCGECEHMHTLAELRKILNNKIISRNAKKEGIAQSGYPSQPKVIQ